MALTVASLQATLRLVTDKWDSGLRDAGRSLETFSRDARKKIGETDSGFEALTKGLERMSPQLQKFGVAMGAAGAAGVVAIGASVAKFIDFEDAIARAVGAAGGGAQDMKLFSDAAKGMALELGAGGVTARAAAESLFSIASAGLKGTDAINVLRPALILAAGTQSNLAQTTESVIATLAQFSLGTNDAGRVTNVFAAANQNALGNVTEFMAAMQKAGPIGQEMGKSIEEVAAGLTIMSLNGLKGAEAGTGLRNVMLKLIDPSKEARDALASVGITMADVDPRTKSLAEIVDVFRAKQADATVVTKLFGLENFDAFQKLRKAGGDALTEMQAKLTGTQASMNQFTTQTKTAGAAMRDLAAQADVVMINMGDRFATAIGPGVKALKAMVQSMGEAPDAVQDLVAAVVVAGTAFSGSAATITASLLALPYLIRGVAAAATVAGLTPGGLLIAGFLALGVAIAGTAAALRSLNAESAKTPEAFAAMQASRDAALAREEDRLASAIANRTRSPGTNPVVTARLEEQLAGVRAQRAVHAPPAPFVGDLPLAPSGGPSSAGAPGGSGVPGAANAGAEFTGFLSLSERLREHYEDTLPDAFGRTKEEAAKFSEHLRGVGLAALNRYSDATDGGTREAEKMGDATDALTREQERAARVTAILDEEILRAARGYGELGLATHKVEDETVAYTATSDAAFAALVKLSSEVHRAEDANAVHASALRTTGREAELLMTAYAALGRPLAELSAAERDHVERMVDAQREGRRLAEVSALIARGYTQEQAAALQATMSQLAERQKQRAQDGEYFAFLGGAFQLAALQGQTWSEGLTSVARSAFQSLTAATSDFLFNFITGTATAAETFKQFGLSMLRTITDFLAQQAVRAFLSLLFGGTGPNVSGLPAIFHEGGVVGAAAGAGAGGALGLGLGPNELLGILEKGEAVFSTDSFAKLKDLLGLGEGPSAVSKIGDFVSGGVSSVTDFAAANPGLTAGTTAALLALALQFTGNEDAARAGQILGALAPLIGTGATLASGALAGAGLIGAGSATVAGVSALGAAGTAGAAVGGGVAGASAGLGVMAASMAPLAAAGAAMAWVMLPLIIGPLISGSGPENPLSAHEFLSMQLVEQHGGSFIKPMDDWTPAERDFAAASRFNFNLMATDFLPHPADPSVPVALNPGVTQIAGFLDPSNATVPQTDEGPTRDVFNDFLQMRAWEAQFGTGLLVNADSFKTGIARVPGGANEPFPAILHGGERVLTAAQADAQDRTGGQGGGARVRVDVTWNTLDPASIPRETRRRLAEELARDIENAMVRNQDRRVSVGRAGRG